MRRRQSDRQVIECARDQRDETLLLWSSWYLVEVVCFGDGYRMTFERPEK